MRTYSYESILGAVGRMLDMAGARAVALREAEHGLDVTAEGTVALPKGTLTLSLKDLADLVSWTAAGDEPHYERARASDEGTLRELLARHELVGARG